jgi:hypothetical protein
MSLGGRLLVYVSVLSTGLVLGLVSLFGHLALAHWLSGLAMIPDACANGCPEAPLVILVGPFLVLMAAAVGLFVAAPRRLIAAALLAVLAYGAALRLAPFGVQYACAVAFFSILALAAGLRGGARLRPATSAT